MPSEKEGPYLETPELLTLNFFLLYSLFLAGQSHVTLDYYYLLFSIIWHKLIPPGESHFRK